MYTKASWEVVAMTDGNGKPEGFWIAAKQNCIARVDFTKDEYAEQKANARLISAAPDMYEALKMLIRKDVQECVVLWEQAVLDAETAIAKAEGK